MNSMKFFCLLLCLVIFQPIHSCLSCEGHPITVVPELSQKQWKGRIVVIWSGLGEYAWAKRMQRACQNLGWEMKMIIDPAELSAYDRLVQDRPSTQEEVELLVQEFDPDCVISLKWHRIYAKGVPHYLSVTGVFQDYKPREDLLQFNGFLMTTKAEALEQFVIGQSAVFHSMEWYPSATATEYRYIEPKEIFYCGFQWDRKRNGPEYQKMFSLLDQTGRLNIYGPAHKWDCAPHSVRGMTFEEEQFQQAMQESGIVLVLHTQRNIDQSAPAARVFEAAAASCIIITDKNPFIEKEFGDCVLYVDQDLPGEELFQQIWEHYQWILANPDKVKEMVKRAHEIFFSKFTLEKQLEKLRLFHLDSSITN